MMPFAQPVFVNRQRRFGRGPAWINAAPPQPSAVAPSDELKLFATTFAGGFLFVSLLLA